jgi:hypothetical protein
MYAARCATFVAAVPRPLTVCGGQLVDVSDVPERGASAVSVLRRWEPRGLRTAMSVYVDSLQTLCLLSSAG